MMALYDEFERQPNRLIDAQSAYLRDAAYQPVGWYEYGPEAFAEAATQQKPLLLDIGAAWCHWCHVIDRESYEDPDIATLVNELFIPVKVDRDERPDIDARYQLAVQLLTGAGGWPLTVFLTPDGEPFFGGTYFPPDDHADRVGMRTLLPRIAEAYRDHRTEMLRVAHTLSLRTQQVETQAIKRAEISDESVTRITESIRQRFNPTQGGFERGAPKFPHPGAIEMALLQYHSEGDQWRTVVVNTLAAMANGGIHDHLEGGFHRYSTDANWIVPHFEKLGSDNAQLLRNYAQAYRALDIGLFRATAEDTLDFILHILSDREHGGFYASQDADNAPDDDGDYWTWSEEEFRHALTQEEAAVLTDYYGVRAGGNMPQTGRNVLHITEPPELLAHEIELPVDDVRQRIESGKRRLLQARRHRKPPAVDHNIYADVNGLLIAACLHAGRLLEHADSTDFALRSADRMLRDAYDDAYGFYHGLRTGAGARLPGFLADQVYMGIALLEAFAVGGKREYLVVARHIADICLTHYWDDEFGCFVDIDRRCATDAATSFLRRTHAAVEDQSMPSPNALAALLLDRLWLLTGEERYHDHARITLDAFAGHAPDYGVAAAWYGLAVHFHLHPPPCVTIIGTPGAADTSALHAVARASDRPGLLIAPYAPADAPEQYPPSPRGEAVAYVCVGTNCKAPTSDIETLRQSLRKA